MVSSLQDLRKNPINEGIKARVALRKYAFGGDRYEAKWAVQDVKIRSSCLATLLMGGRREMYRAARERREYLSSLESD
ncbi:hypothetical protein GW924_02395 [Candidatus Pacearchaeota archaeon]|nr:hypothetical protein [Candidatus Pacearchaeota archaeon]